MSITSVAEVAVRGYHNLVDPGLRTLLDELKEGALVVDIAGVRLYSNPALDLWLGRDACLPMGAVDAPPWLPRDQRQRFMVALQASSSILTMDGYGRASTSFEVLASSGARVATTVTICSFRGGSQRRVCVWLLKADADEPARGGSAPSSSDGAGRWRELETRLSTAAAGSLTPREKEVVALLLEGRRVSSVARLLYVSPQTVRNHLKSIFRKLSLHSQAELLDFLNGPGAAGAAERVRLPLGVPATEQR